MIKELEFSTLTVQGSKTDKVLKPITSAISCTSSYEVTDSGYSYSRLNNPNREELELVLASLEKGKYGLVFSSGMAALGSIMNILTPEDEVICMKNVYAGSYNYIRQYCSTKKMKVQFHDFAKDPEGVSELIGEHTTLIWLESPTNPNLELADIKLISSLASKKNPRIMIAVDNTFLTPLIQKPLEFGADLVVHSITKYLNGHSDLVMGALIMNNHELYNKIKFQQVNFGAVPSAFDCFLARRGLKTLHLRMERHSQNALQVAQFLDNHPKVEKTIYPGLRSHPQFELAQKQHLDGLHGGIVSIILPNYVSFIKNIKVFKLAESLGGVESTLKIPYCMNAISISEELEHLNISPNLIRISVGIEDVKDLIDTLASALSFI